MEHTLNAFIALMHPTMMLCMIAGVAAGLVAGALPGISATMAMALFTPLTYNMDKSFAFSVLCAIYVGAISGGLYSAILLRIPGTNASIVTTFDGFPMARQGKAPQAIGIALVASFIGSTVGFLFLSTCSTLLARVALKFGPAEYFAVALLGLSTIASLVGDSSIKGMISAMFGLALSTIGLDPMSGVRRFTFGSPYLTGGVAFIAVLIGFFAIPQILKDFSDPAAVSIQSKVRIRDMLPNFRELAKHWPNFLRSSLIGTWVGVLPATGSTTAALIAYDQAKKASKHPETFGTGDIDGIIAPETANNAVIGGSFIPMLTLGIPGDSPAAVMLAALTIHGLQAGPLLFQTNPGEISTIIVSMWVSGLLMIVIAFIGAKYIIGALRAPKHILLSLIFCLCCTGAYSVNQSWFDVFVMVGMGMFAFLMDKYGFSTGPAVLGLILGSLVESNLRRAVQVSNTGIWGVVSRPITAVVLIITLLSFLWPFIQALRKRAREKKEQNDASRAAPENANMTAVKKNNRVIAILLATLAAAYFIWANALPILARHGKGIPYDPGFFPKVIAAVLVLLAVLLHISRVSPRERIAPGFPNKKRAFIQIGLMVLYPLSMINLGFVVSTAAYLLISFMFIGKLPKSKLPQSALIAIVSTLVFYLLLERVFVVILPHGILF